MIKEYFLVNENGEKYALNDKINTVFKLTSEFGFSYKYTFSQVENYFIENTKDIEQQKISGKLTILNEKNFLNFIKFIQLNKNLKFMQIKNNITYYIDVTIEQLKMSNDYNYANPIKLDFSAKSLWYEAKEVVYSISKIENEIRWDFLWNSVFTQYDSRKLIYENKGHISAPFLLEINGVVDYPKIEILDTTNNILNILNLDTLNILENEKLVYSTKDTELKIYKVLADKTEQNLNDMLDINNINFFKFPLRC